MRTNNYEIELVAHDEPASVELCISAFTSILEKYESVLMGYGFGYDNMEMLRGIVGTIITSFWQKELVKSINAEIEENVDLKGRGKVYELDELLRRLTNMYESNKTLFDSLDIDRNLDASLKYWESEKERMAVEISEAMDVLKKSVTYEGLLALQCLAGTRQWDVGGDAYLYRQGAEERFSRLIEEADGVVKMYNRVKEMMKMSESVFGFVDANEAFIELRKLIDGEKLFPMDELLAEGNEIVYESANKNDVKFPRALNEEVCEVCNGVLFEKVSENAFIYAINHPHQPYPLTKLKDQNNRIFFMIYALSRCLRSEVGKLWVATMLDVLDLKRSTYDSKATFCIGAYASPDDRAFVDRMKEAFEKAGMTCTW